MLSFGRVNSTEPDASSYPFSKSARLFCFGVFGLVARSRHISAVIEFAFRPTLAVAKLISESKRSDFASKAQAMQRSRCSVDESIPLSVRSIRIGSCNWRSEVNPLSSSSVSKFLTTNFSNASFARIAIPLSFITQMTGYNMRNALWMFCGSMHGKRSTRTCLHTSRDLLLSPSRRCQRALWAMHCPQRSLPYARDILDVCS
mmetsp:Transcript_26946/g.37875  ORF Transcript_26946/g.37875 Transcript_26946/m.37875 type:complete len:202 (+) Transcript_26946:1772-2377(+)